MPLAINNIAAKEMGEGAGWGSEDGNGSVGCRGH